MFTRCAALVIAATLQFTPLSAQAFDASAYYGDKAFEILATGDVAPILEADPAMRNRITFYAMSVAGKLHYLWSDRMTADFGDRAFLRAMLIAPTLEMETDEMNALLNYGTLDAVAFAERHAFDSVAAQTLLTNLTILLEN